MSVPLTTIKPNPQIHNLSYQMARDMTEERTLFIYFLQFV